MRVLDSTYPELPRAGEAQHPAEEPIRLGQDPSLAFVTSPITRYRPRTSKRTAQLRVGFLGMFGPQGGLPLHLTEFARDRVRGLGDKTFASFVDIFHHRMLLLLHRSWAMGQPTACHDRPSDTRFLRYLGSLCGRGVQASWGRDAVPDHAKLQFVGRLAPPTRNAEGLVAMVGHYFSVEARIEPFVGEWLPMEESDRWRLGGGAGHSQLGTTTMLGARTYLRSHRFRLVLGPLGRSDFDSFLPGAERLAELSALVKCYIGDELAWDVKLELAAKEQPQMILGRTSRMGYNTWLNTPDGEGGNEQSIIVEPLLPQAS